MVRKMDFVKPGQESKSNGFDRGDYRFIRQGTAPKEGVVDWLLSCPQKDLFVPVGSGSTESFLKKSDSLSLWLQR